MTINKISFLKTKRKIPITFMLIALVSLIFMTSLAKSAVLSDKVYTGIKVENKDVSNLSFDELKRELESKYYNESNLQKSIILKAGDSEEKIYFKDLDVIYNIDNVTKEAYDVGRKGNIIDRLSDILSTRINGKKLNVKMKYDSSKFEEIIEKLDKKVRRDIKEHEVIIENDQAIIKAGQGGMSIDRKGLVQKINDKIATNEFGVIQVDLTKVEPKKVTVDEIYNKIFRPEQDAYYSNSGGVFKVEKEQDGRDVEKVALSNIVSKLSEEENKEYKINLIALKPKKIKSNLESNLFKDTLASETTQFYTRDAVELNRAGNIKVAVKYINGAVVLPGGEFSYNDRVGRRTSERGFLTAKIYVGNQIVDGLGGGICQTASTLHIAAVKAGMQINERSCHMFMVTYVALGTDAAVSESSDLRFKNTTQWPVKILCSTSSDNRVTFSLIGTNEYPGRSFGFITNKISDTPYSTEYVSDPELVHSGMNGAVVETYLAEYKNGVQVSKKKAYTSNYKPYNEKILKDAKTETNTPVTASANTTANASNSAEKTPEPVVTTSPTVTNVVTDKEQEIN